MDKFPQINMVGVEMEGGWDPDNPTCDDIKSDCSVQVNDHDDDDYDEDDDGYSHGRYKNGEYVTSPISKWQTLVNEMKDNYPDKVNSTCGLHVHVSVPTIPAYEALMNERFYNFLKKSLRVWGKKNNIPSHHNFWHRLKGNNQYCEDFHNPDSQVWETGKGGDRYCIVNYCYSCHGTMEVRVLPMFEKKSLSVSAVERVLWTVQRYLSLPGAFKGSEPVSYDFTVECDIPEGAIEAIPEVINL
jgi:hypothetical protein